MISKKTTVVSSEEQLLEARQKGRAEAQQLNAMKVHGKVLGMDTFSWVNPQIDALITLLNSLPFSMVWAGNSEQVKWCLEESPELITKMETIIVHDSATLNLEGSTVHQLTNVVFVEGAQHALELVKAMKLSKGAFIFTAIGGNAQEEINTFEEFIGLHK